MFLGVGAENNKCVKIPSANFFTTEDKTNFYVERFETEVGNNFRTSRGTIGKGLTIENHEFF